MDFFGRHDFGVGIPKYDWLDATLSQSKRGVDFILVCDKRELVFTWNLELSLSPQMHINRVQQNSL